MGPSEKYIGFCKESLPGLKTVDGKRIQDLKPEKPEKSKEEPRESFDEDMSSPGLVKVISKEWERELKRIKEKGLNGYKRKKEQKHESLV